LFISVYKLSVECGLDCGVVSKLNNSRLLVHKAQGGESKIGKFFLKSFIIGLSVCDVEDI